MTPEDLLKLRRHLDAIRTSLEELRDAIQEHSKGVASEQQNRQVNAVIAYEGTAAEARNDANRQYSIQRSIRNWTRGAVFAASIYAAIAAYQACQMRKATQATEIAAAAAKKSADLAWRTAAATGAARCEFGANFDPRIAHGSISVTCEGGKVDATILHGNFLVTLINPETSQDLSESQRQHVGSEIIGPDQGAHPLDFGIPGFSESEYVSLRQGIKVEGSIEYNDGFDRTQHFSDCYVFLPELDAATGKYNGTNNPHACGAGVLDKLRRYREDDEARKKKKKNQILGLHRLPSVR